MREKAALLRSCVATEWRFSEQAPARPTITTSQKRLPPFHAFFTISSRCVWHCSQKKGLSRQGGDLLLDLRSALYGICATAKAVQILLFCIVHPIKGATKKGVKRSRLKVCAVANLVILSRCLWNLWTDNFYKKYHLVEIISHFFINFVTIPRHSSVQEGHVFNKVLLKLSSKIKFSQNLKRYEDDGSSTTSLVCTALIGSLHIHWCGLLFYPYRRQCEKPDFRIRQQVPTPYFYFKS